MASRRKAPDPLYPGLSGGPGRMAPEAVTQHQRRRLEGAMIEAVSRHGYAGTTLRDLVGMAGVSKSTFYEHFANKEECFLATMDELMDQATERVAAALQSERDSGGDFRGRMEAAFNEAFKMVVENPTMAWLMVVESVAVGPPGIEHLEKATVSFEAMIQQGFEQFGEPPLSALTVRTIADGGRAVTFRRLREGTQDQLSQYVPDLVKWCLDYQQPTSQLAKRGSDAARAEAARSEETVGTEDASLSWEEPPDSPRSRKELSQRERIIRATARVAAERGYAALSIPAISGAAGVSNQTFYEYFPSKIDAFMAACDALIEPVMMRAGAASARHEKWPENISAGMQVILEEIAARPLYPRVAFVEMAAAGPAALARGDKWLEMTNKFVSPPESAEGIVAPPPVVLEAIVGGIWGVIRTEVVHGRAASLPKLGPELMTIVLNPFGES